ncbi:MAG: histidine kinase N-terminal domain-containing protein [Eubacterium sp.]|nr:histidine kinase N-terminal domain-containing protein [Eubacterium sp.]
MANTKEECKELCGRYTTLREEEIGEIYPFLDDLQMLAEREQANVYIDCMTFTGKSMIIVGEAFPESRGTIYTEPLFGKIMYTKNEPAVARTFVTGIPTKNVTGEEVISERVMIQQVYPIKHRNKTVAVLIYERLYEKQEIEDGDQDVSDDRELRLDIKELTSIIDQMNEGLILVDKENSICYCNSFAAGIFKELGYVGKVFGMEIHNILGNDSEGRYRFQMRGYTLNGRMIDINKGGVKCAIILDDITQEEKSREKIQDLELRLHEERHSMKNGLMFLKEFAGRKAENTEDQEEHEAYSQMIDRIDMLMSITELKLQSGGSIGIRHALEYVFLNKMDLVTGEKDISISITGDDVEVTDEPCHSIISVIYELICNSVKHAFSGRESGRISIEIKQGYLTSQIIYRDDGVGFDPERDANGSHGLAIIKTIVEDKLNGVFKVSSSSEGTVESFDFIV